MLKLFSSRVHCKNLTVRTINKSILLCGVPDRTGIHFSMYTLPIISPFYDLVIIYA